MTSTKSPKTHPYRSGNFAPVRNQMSMEICEVQGTIPDELIGGQYVHNSSNPLAYDDDPSRPMHWFDGHGMLSAIYFSRQDDNNTLDIQAMYSNQYVLTDIYLAESNSRVRAPILPSLVALLSPWSSVFTILRGYFRMIWMVLCSWVGHSLIPIRRISVANVNVVYHDGRFLALCETGPPMRVTLPDLKTVGWFNGCMAEGEFPEDSKTVKRSGFAGDGLLSFFREWTTAHPHIDPLTGEMMLLHPTFIRPYTRYSVLAGSSSNAGNGRQIFGKSVPEVLSPKIMHDFGVSRRNTVIIDMPLSLDPFGLAFGESAIAYNSKGQTRFGIFPRHVPELVQWFATEPCCIFHTVNTWEDTVKGETAVSMLVCRMTGPSMVYATGNLPLPTSQGHREEECRLYYYQFSVGGPHRAITEQWALSAIPFEVPHVPKHLTMSATRFVYGCSVAGGNYADHLENALKIGSFVKFDVQKLIARGLANHPTSVSGCVDNRSVEDILASDDPDDPIQIFPMPKGIYGQECVFVPRSGGKSEDDGWLLTLVFDESQLDVDGNAPDDCKSELWVIDAKTMKGIVVRIKLPQRVPYGFHGNWFSEHEIAQQHPVKKFRSQK
ncbi:carotenoid oxygenase [Ilyonectria sp. MPI-CAGE-AT-0026]|nr:carotenoid oxygenase [Ilyonectria sp. MPI-CAGE-AT-0026]